MIHFSVSDFLPLAAMGNCLWRDLASTMICACLFKKPRVGTSSSSSVSEAASAADVLLSTASVVTSTGSLRCPDCKHSTCHCEKHNSTCSWCGAMLCLRQLVPGHSLHSPRICGVQSGTGTCFLPVLRFYPVCIIPPMLRTHSSICHHR